LDIWKLGEMEFIIKLRDINCENNWILSLNKKLKLHETNDSWRSSLASVVANHPLIQFANDANSIRLYVTVPPVTAIPMAIPILALPGN